MWPRLRLLFLTLWPRLRLLFLIVAWLTFNYFWQPFTHTSASARCSLDKRRNSLAAWFVSVQDRIVALRGLERPVPPCLDRHTQSVVIGRQRGLQRALGVSVPPWAWARIRTRARDSTCMGKLLGDICVWRNTCLDTACVSKTTKWWGNTTVVLGPAMGVPRMGTYRWHRREKCR